MTTASERYNALGWLQIATTPTMSDSINNTYTKYPVHYFRLSFGKLDSLLTL